MTNELFPTSLPEREFVEFTAQGFPTPACGVIHRKKAPARNGLPLGGVGTGCIDLETDGTFGFTTIFNSHVPRRGPLNLPFLGLAVQNDKVAGGFESWVLSTRRLNGEMFTGLTFGLPLPRRAAAADDISYWGHYPVADLEFQMDCPVKAGLRAWAPFVLGEAELSNTPGIVFEVHLRNPTNEVQTGTLAFSFPGPSSLESTGNASFDHTRVNGSFDGVVVANHQGMEYALGIANIFETAPQGGQRWQWTCQVGGDFGLDGRYWANFCRGGSMDQPLASLPQALNQPGASVGVDFELQPGQEKIVPFILAWHCPTWKGGGGALSGGQTYHHKYAERTLGAYQTAVFLASNHQAILRRILAWQAVIYADQSLPVWLRESLVNILHLIAEDGMWAQARLPIGDWCRQEDGLFGMNECPRGCPQIECIPCSFYGNMPLVYFFPELALSTLRGYKAYQFPAGNAPWVFGGCTVGSPPCELALPSAGYAHKPQTTLDGPCYVDMIERLWLRTGDRLILEEFYDSMKRNTIFTLNLRPESGPAGIVSMPSGNNGQDWIEFCDLYGIVPHIGGVHLANLKMAERMAREIGDEAFANQCANWFQQGSEALEENTWTGNNYLLYHEPETGKQSAVVMGCQLDGEWMVNFHGLESVFRPDRIQTTLKTLAQTNIAKHGAIVFQIPEGSDFIPGYWGESGLHFPSSIMLAATYLYHGFREQGIDLAERTVRAMVLENLASWDSMLLFLGDNAEFLWGADYYQNMMLWALPAAMAGTDLVGPCQAGGLVQRMVQAAASKVGD